MNVYFPSSVITQLIIDNMCLVSVTFIYPIRSTSNIYENKNNRASRSEVALLSTSISASHAVVSSQEIEAIRFGSFRFFFSVENVMLQCKNIRLILVGGAVLFVCFPLELLMCGWILTVWAVLLGQVRFSVSRSKLI